MSILLGSLASQTPLGPHDQAVAGSPRLWLGPVIGARAPKLEPEAQSERPDVMHRTVGGPEHPPPMHLRRVLLLFAVVLAGTAIVSALAPRRRDAATEPLAPPPQPPAA